MVIAIDGPAGAGKSSVARAVAHQLGFTYLDSGAMYRALALKAVESDISVDDEDALDRLAHQSNIKLEPRLDGNRVLLDGENISERYFDREHASLTSIDIPVLQCNERIGVSILEGERLGLIIDGPAKLIGNRYMRGINTKIDSNSIRCHQ